MIRPACCSLVLALLHVCSIHAETPSDKNPGRLKLAIVNPRTFTSDSWDAKVNKANIQANLDRHLAFVDQLAPQGVEFIGFPELSVNGYHFSSGMTWLSLDGPEVKQLRAKARERGVYISAGIAEQDAAGQRWNTHFVIDPQGFIIGKHNKIELTDEEGYTRSGSTYQVFKVKGVPMGLAICADGSEFRHLQMLVRNGARVIHAPHATRNDGTTSGWYNFRSDWAGADGWIARLKVHAFLHNHAGQYHADFKPPVANWPAGPWCSGSWIIDPDGKTVARMPWSNRRSDSKEHVLIHDVPIPTR